MPVRTAYAGAAVAGEVLTAANVNKIPGGWIGYAEVTANQAGITAETALTGLSLAVTVGASRRIRVSVHVRLSSATGSATTTHIKEGATNLQLGVANIIAGAIWTTTYSVVLTPSAGAHTYSAALSGTTSTDLQAAATYPSYILVEDLGPAT